jgi:hypothetical protein
MVFLVDGVVLPEVVGLLDSLGLTDILADVVGVLLANADLDEL